MKKIIFYLLFSIFIYQIGGYIISFNIMKYSIESKMKLRIKQNLSNEAYSIFNYNQISNHTTFKWEEKGKEFWYDGKIYDIVKRYKSGTLKCIADTQEKKIFKNLEGYVNGFFTKNPNGKKSLQTINSLFFAVFLPAKEISIPNRFCLFVSSISQKIITSNDTITLSVLSPPPRFL